MDIETVPNRNSRPAILLREGARIRKRTLANLTDWPPAQVQALRAVLKGDYDLLSRFSPCAQHCAQCQKGHANLG